MYDFNAEPEPKETVRTYTRWGCEVQGCKCVCQYKNYDVYSTPLYETACCNLLSESALFLRIYIISLRVYYFLEVFFSQWFMVLSFYLTLSVLLSEELGCQNASCLEIPTPTCPADSFLSKPHTEPGQCCPEVPAMCTCNFLTCALKPKKCEG